MTARRRLRALLATASVLYTSACFGEYAPGSAETDAAETTSAATSASTSTGTGPGSSSSTTHGTSDAPTCERLDVLILTDVSISMAPFANGIIDVLLALGPRIEERFGNVASYNMALAYNAPPMVNEEAFEVPLGGGGCTQLGALVRGVDACMEDFDGRPYLNETDDLGAGLTCLGGGLISGQWSPIYETPRTLDTLVTILEGEDDPALSACNAGFHESPDPLLVIVIVDSEDESEASVLQAVTAAVATQGSESSLENVGIFLVGENTMDCPAGPQPDNCEFADPACRVEEFIDRGLLNVGFPGNVRRFNICRAREEDTEPVAAAFLEQISAVVDSLCE